MGRLCVTELPRGRAQRPSDHGTGRRAHLPYDRPPRLELVSADPRGLVFKGRQRVRAPILVSPLVLLLAAVPWLGPAPPDAVQLLVSAACLGAAVAMACFSWPGVYRLHMQWQDGDNDPSGSVGSGIENPRWILDVEAEPDSPRCAYSVHLELEGAERWTVLRSPHPDAVLRQLRTLLTHCPAPVDCRWGISGAASPWNFEPTTEAAEATAEPWRALVRAPACGPGLLWSMAVMTVLVLVDLVFLVSSESEKLPAIHPLSVILPLVLAGSLVTITVVLATARACLRITSSVLEEECVFGVRRRRGQVRLGSVRDIHVVGAPASAQWHVLIDSADGPLAMPVERHEADVLAHETRLAIAAAHAQSRTSNA